MSNPAMVVMCGKCRNTNLQDARHELDDFYVKVLVWMKCFACGWRGKPIVQKLRDKPEEGTMPKFHSEEHKAAWVASVRASKQRKKEAEAEAQGKPRPPALPALIPKAKPVLSQSDPRLSQSDPLSSESIPVSLIPRAMDHGSINAALERLEDDAATLRRAAQIIQRVNA